MKPRLFSLATCAITLLAMATMWGCGNGSSEGAAAGGSKSSTGGKSLNIGFSQIGAESSWRTAETQSVQDEAKKRGINLTFSDAQGKQENQIKAVRAFIAKKVDGIILAPVVETGWDPVLKEAKAAGIPVILADRGVKVSDEELYVTLVGSDFEDEGRRAATYLVDKLGKKGNIVELQGTPGSAAAIDRTKGLQDVLAKNPDVKIIKSQTGEFTRAKGREVMEAFLKSDGKNINGVYAHNDDMALGAIQAIEAAGLKPGTDIIIVSIDGVKGALEALIAGKLNCSVECNPLLGATLFDAMNDAKAGKKLPKKIVVKDDQFDKAAAEKAIATRKY